jgi:hypothetical protein
MGEVHDARLPSQRSRTLGRLVTEILRAPTSSIVAGGNGLRERLDGTQVTVDPKTNASRLIGSLLPWIPAP